MEPVDDRILEAIREHGNLTPRALEHFDVTTREHGSRRCKVLAKYGLLDRIVHGLYAITDEGLAYLEEDLDASELEPSE